MKQTILRYLVAGLILILPVGALAVDAPHSNLPGYNIQCGNCHWTNGAGIPPWATIANPLAPADNTLNNRRCYVCHDGSKGIIKAETHSTSTTSNRYWNPQGGWKTECVTCHDPHTQQQTQGWGSSSYLWTGSAPVTVGTWNTINGNWTTVTVSGVPIPNNYAGYYFMPDIRYALYYEVVEDTTNKNTFKVKGQVPAAYVGTGGYAFVYGKNVRNNIVYANPANTPAVGGTVKLFTPNGTNDLADSANYSTSVCYVCHSQGDHWSRKAGADVSHNEGAVCSSCHPHVIGFKAQCDGCHGNPPTNSTSFAYPDGLAWTTRTGSTVAGAHGAHTDNSATGPALLCNACHYDSVGSGVTHNNQSVTIGFGAFGGASTGGAYVGQNGVSYNATTTVPNATTATAGGSKTCSNIYCHGSSIGGPNTAAVWDGAAGSLNCTNSPNGACHNASASNAPTLGSHTKHASSTGYSMGCTVCHPDAASQGAKHVNADVAWNFGTDSRTTGAQYNNQTTSSTGSPAPSSTYSSCTNLYCHSQGTATYTAPNTTPTWGVAAGGACGACHGADAATPPASSSHAKHVGSSSVYRFACQKCHSVTVDATATNSLTTPGIASKTAHVNNIRDVDLMTSDTLLVGAAATDNGAGTCSNVYCHSTGKAGVVPEAQLPGTYSGSHYSDVTWGDTLTCASCHGKSQSGYPDYTMANQNADKGTGRANSHQSGTHRGTNCSVCHNETTTDGTTIASSQHVNGAIKVAFDAGHGGGAGATYNVDKSCSNVSCHGSTSPVWGAAGDCSTCHDAGLGGISGAHSKHWDTAAGNAGSRLTGNSSTATYYQFQCGTCHTGGTHPTGSTGQFFADLGFNITWAPTGAQTNGAYTQGSGNTVDSRGQKISQNGTCNTVYCHSAGIAPGAGAPAYKSNVAWNGTTSCTFCHDAPPATNAHTKHATTYSMGCVECHQATVSNNTTVSDKTKHVNGVNDVAWQTAGKNTGGDNYEASGADTCSNIYCHSKGQVTVAPYTTGVNAGNAPNTAAVWNGTTKNCEGCHNYDANATNKMDTGKHTQHINNATVIGTNYGCQECHNSTTTNGTSITTPANHVNKVKDVSILRGGNADCTSTYCHSTGQANPTYVNRTWGEATDLTCKGCHGTEAGSIAGEPRYANGAQPAVVENNDNSHPAHVASAADCVKCHAETVEASGTAIKAGSTLHTNGTRNVNIAAAYDTNGGADNYNAPGKTCSSISCHGASSPMWGGTVACGSCHAVNNTLPESHPTHYGVATSGSRVLDTKVNDSTAYVFQCGSCHNSVPHADGNKDVAISGTWGGSMDGTRTCSNVYCHSDGNGGPGAVNPQWAVTAMTCGSCHAAQPATARHTKHVDDATYNIRCFECHAVTVTNAADGSVVINDKFQHVDKTKDVDWGSLSSGGTAYVNPTTNCSNIYCHSDGKSATAPFGAPKDAVKWGTAFTTTCTSCHDSANPTTTLSGAHKAHIDGATSTVGRNLGCEQCHNDTVSNSTTIRPAGYALHVNKAKDIKVAIDGTACNNIKCHSNGNFDGTVTYNNPNFATGTIGCVNCHGDGATKSYPSYADGGAGTGASNSHNAHVGTSGIKCEECHNTVSIDGTAINGTTPANHVNQAVDVSFKQGGSYNGVPNTATTETCSTTYCHGGTTPTWGGAHINCDGCHDATNAGGLSTRHDKHFASATAATDRSANNNHSATGYVFGCGNCHPNGTTHATGAASAVQAAEIGGTKQTNANYTPGGSSLNDGRSYKYSNIGTCATVCHTKDGSTAGSAIVATPAWNGSNALGCGYCHSKPADATRTWSLPHDKHLVTYAANTNINCGSCHAGTATDNATINGSSGRGQHPNANKDVAMGAFPGGTVAGAQGAQQCSNTYCHSQGTSFTAPTHTAVSWSGSTACNSCHGDTTGVTGTDGMPNYTGGGANKANSHLAHVRTNNYTCNICHNDTTTTGNTITTVASHVNKAYNLQNGGTATFTPTIGNPTTPSSCATISCHGGNGATWGATLTCANCHMGTGDQDDYSFGNGTTARIDSTEWTSRGHGQASINLACADCHDGTVGHNVSTNPFRLANIGTKLNDNCLVCHATGSTGYNSKNSTVKVDKYHGGANHDATRNGGQFCFDCHDPHGDGSNIKMVQSKPAKKSNAYGVPTELPTNPVVFTNDTIGAGAGGFAMTSGTFENGICNTCHTYSAAAPKMTHYTSTSSDATTSHYTTVCTSCHKHNGADTAYNGGAFQGAGDCNGCHDYDTRVANNWGDGYTALAVEGFGAHKKHIDHIKSRFGIVTLNPAGQTFGTGDPARVCGTCHTNNSGEHGTGVGTGGRVLNFGDGRYREGSTNGTDGFGIMFDPSATTGLPATLPRPQYNGSSGSSSSVSPKSCSAVGCHFTTTPVWSAY